MGKKRGVEFNESGGLEGSGNEIQEDKVPNNKTERSDRSEGRGITW